MNKREAKWGGIGFWFIKRIINKGGEEIFKKLHYTLDLKEATEIIDLPCTHGHQHKGLKNGPP